MAAKENQEKINRLLIYAEGLKARLTGGIPPKHANAPEAFKQMIEIDLKKTEAKIRALRGV